MSIVKNFREYYQECFKAEKPKFIRVIKGVPSDQAGYRPHPRSTCAGDLVWLLASELRDACELVDRGEVSYVVRPAPTIPESVAAYERNAEDLVTCPTRRGKARRANLNIICDVRHGGVGSATLGTAMAARSDD